MAGRVALAAGAIGGIGVLATIGIVLKLSVYRIGSGSMAPALPPGTIVIDSGALRPRVHEAITFATPAGPVTHVLLGTRPDGSLITRGLANRADDRWPVPVYPRDIRGVVFVRILLFAPSLWTSRQGAVVSAGAGLVALALWLRHRSGAL